MNWDLLTVAVMTGLANWAFRALPVMIRSERLGTNVWLDRFLSATGPAAIATLFIASILPAISAESARLLPLVAGTGSVLAIWFARRSVVLATVAGAVVHGLATWLTL